ALSPTRHAAINQPARFRGKRAGRASLGLSHSGLIFCLIALKKFWPALARIKRNFVHVTPRFQNRGRASPRLRLS
ncbi:MAG: hypothetical protein ACN6OQ_19055, partial [Paraburkholderia nemoris]